MTIMTKFLAGGLGLAAMAAAAPASAQYQYGYPPYGNAYGYYNNSAHVTQMAASQCTAAVQARLNNRHRNGLAGLIGALAGAQTSARVVAVTQVTPRQNRVRVRGIADSGRYAYNPYGYGYYGAQGYGYANAGDLAFRCEVDYRGRVRDVDIFRRR